MIELFQGRIGGGKTYNAVLRIAEVLGQGGHVYTNIEINPSGMELLVRKMYRVRCVLSEQFHFLEQDMIPKYYENLRSGSFDFNVLCVIDEAQLFFNARDWGKMDASIITFNTQSRKVFVDLILITQNISLIDKQLRTNAQFVWGFKDFARLVPGFPFPVILAVRCDVDGRTKIDHRWQWKKQIVFSAYNSFALLRPHKIGSLKAHDKVSLQAANSSIHLPYRINKMIVRSYPLLGFLGICTFCLMVYRVLQILVL